MSTGGSWEPEPAIIRDPNYYQVTPLPADNVDLWPDDLVVMQYDLFQLGDWVIGYQVGKIERDLEADERFVLKSYVYDENAKTLTVICRRRRRDEMSAKVYLAGAFGWGVVAGLVAVGVTWLGYEMGKRVQVYRTNAGIQRAIDEGIITPEQGAELKDGIGSADAGPGVIAAVAGVGSGLVILAVAVVALILWRGRG